MRRFHTRLRGGGSAYRLGQIATACFTTNDTNASFHQMMSRTRHVVKQDVSQLQLVFPSWKSAEATVGANGTITAAIEYPVGTFTQITFSGSAGGVIPDGSYLLSDPVNVTIPKDAAVFVRTYYTNSVGIVFNQYRCNTTLGEAATYAASGVVDQTMGGTVTNTAGTPCYGPVAILAMTALPSFFLIGDSRIYGVNDTLTSGSDGLGELARSFGDNYPYINAGVAGSTATQMASQGAAGKRALLGQYCTHVLHQFGINDIATHTAAVLEADVQTIHGLFSGKKFYPCTVAPRSTSTDSWATLGNQTADAQTPQRILYNNWVRANTGAFAGYIELADQVESARDSGLWKAPGYTADGLHETQAGYVAIQNSGAINPAAL